MKRLIKSELFDGFNYGKKYYEVYKNPTQEEIEIIRNQHQFKAIRGSN